MRVLVDADACPVKELIIKIAKENSIEVIMLIDTSHELNDNYSKVITVDKGRDSVDLRLISLLKKEDIVVTQDFGVATLTLGKGARALNQNGMEYTNENIDRLMFERFLGNKVRRAGGKGNSIKKRNKDDDERFARKFNEMLKQSN